MGGINELKILGFRAHVNSGIVHLHTEDGMKFESNVSKFKEDISEAVKELNGGDGAVAIPGLNGVSLVVGRHGSRSFTTLTRDTDATDDLKRWVESC